MKKIMFKDRYGLTEAVLELYKTMTRRIIGQHVEVDWNRRGKVHLPISGFRNGILYMDCRELLPDSGKFDYAAPKQYQPRYAIGEEVAIAQCYSNISDRHDDWLYNKCAEMGFNADNLLYEAGWFNKMFVKADLMPHRIRNLKFDIYEQYITTDCEV